MKEQKVNDLKSRIALCEFCIRTLEGVPDDEPLKADALEHYRKQLEVLKARLPKPPPTVIKLKAATLSGVVPKLGE